MPVSHRLRVVGSGLALLLAFVIVLFASWPASAQTPDPQLIQEGADLYAANCAVCHGPNGEGRVGATLAKNWPSIRPALTVRSIIENGVPGSPMPAWSEANGGPLDQQQIDALVAFILSWQTGGAQDLAPRPTATAHPPITPLPEVQGDPNQGAVLFGDNCVVCHGPNGEGKIGATLPTNWPSVRPDLNIKSTISQGVPGSIMPAWSQANGGPLSEEQINNLVAYILSRPDSVVEQVKPDVEAVPDRPLSWLSGWGGVVLLIVLLVVVIGGAIWYQARTQKPEGE